MNETPDNPADLLWRIAATNTELSRIREEKLQKSWDRLVEVMEKGRRSPIPRRMAKLFRLLLWCGIFMFSFSFIGLIVTKHWIFLVTGSAAMVFMVWAAVEISKEK